MSAYYNEIDPYAAQWLRNLIAAGHIAPGDVDERSIEDVRPDDLRPYTQCHFFAGIGIWSHALRLAEWPDDRPVWTGSCPCQPFSAAGKGAGFADERHLWPAFFHLIRESRPASVFGEQVASKDGLAWFDAVSADMEGAGYAIGAADLCAAGVGAPHIRQRLFFGAYDTRSAAGGVGNAAGARRIAARQGAESETRDKARLRMSGVGCEPDRLEHATRDGREQGRAEPERGSIASGRGSERLADTISERGRRREPRRQNASDAWVSGEARGLADADRGERGRQSEHGEHERDRAPGRRQQGNGEPAGGGAALDPRPTNGFWRDADWLYCTDGKWRPVEPGTLPLAHGYPQRVGRLRAYGNAIVAQVAAGFIVAAEEARMNPERPEPTLFDLMEDAQ